MNPYASLDRLMIMVATTTLALKRSAHLRISGKDLTGLSQKTIGLWNLEAKNTHINNIAGGLLGNTLEGCSVNHSGSQGLFQMKVSLSGTLKTA